MSNQTSDNNKLIAKNTVSILLVYTIQLSLNGYF